MKKSILSILILGLAIGFTGCANKVHNYSISSENMIHLKGLSKTGGKIQVGTFTDSNKNESKVMCRLATPIGTPKGVTFASYIKDALEKELIIADIYSKTAKNTITANLDYIYGSTGLGNAYWEFNMTVSSSNGKSYKVASKYSYESSFSAMSACSEMQRSFVPAVQQLNGKIITHSKFKSLLF